VNCSATSYTFRPRAITLSRDCETRWPWSVHTIEAKHEQGDWGDLGYPVGCQLGDGKIFTAYYFNKGDGHPQGGTRYIAASTFRIEP